MLTNRFAAGAPMRARPHPAPPRAGAGLSSCAMPARRHDREST
ncbi:thiopurine S-methyltransferase [Burkholderia pseudomallei]|nr:thiopurine S-methyltransferase [Burkholderia pseudomallei]